MNLPDWLLDRLVCPERRDLSLRPAPSDVIDRINARQASGGLTDRGGRRVDRPLTEGLLRSDGRVLYRVDGGIPDLVVEDGIV